MRISAPHLSSKTDVIEQVANDATDLLGRCQSMKANRFCDDVINLHAPIQRRVWVLKYHLHLQTQTPHGFAIRVID